MAKLPRLTGQELAKLVEMFGFAYSHTTGSPMVYRHPDGRRTTIPHHTGEEIGPGLLMKTMKKDLGITREEFLTKVLK